MVFSSAVFVFGFMPLLLFLYFLAEPKYRNYILLIFSLIFYGWGGVNYLLLMLAVVMSDYVFAIAIAQIKTQKIRKLFVVFSVVVNLGVLGYYKYTNFFIENINHFIKNDIKIATIVLPIGISFFTFQAMSYVIDVYRGDVAAQKNPFYVMLYVSLFPQLVAGPIVRYKTVENEIAHRQIHMEDVADGLERFILGFAKKIIIANNVGALADKIFEMNSIDMPLAWLGAIAYTLQIYFDFSAYSDMAIGLGKMFGFEFNMNFNYPYVSKSITEFWRRWHISLSSWFRDYVYIPLGGNRVSKIKHIRNLLIVWFLTGLWHGAAWNFVAWGLYYGVILIIEKYLLSPVLDRLPDVVRHIYSIVLVVIGWVLFFSSSFGQAADYIRVMFGAGAHGFADRESMYLLTSNLILWLILIFGSTPLVHFRYEHMLRSKKWNTTIINSVVYAALFIVCIAYLVTETYNPFLYFRF